MSADTDASSIIHRSSAAGGSVATDKSTLFAFVGQGSQYPGMGKDLASTFPAARYVFDEVDESLGSHLSRTMFHGHETDLRATKNSQPAIVAHSAAILAVLRDEFDLTIDAQSTRALMGHSLGEFTAFYAASSFSLADTVRLVRFRGEEMQKCAPSDGGKMVALFPLRKGIDSVADLCAQSQRMNPGHICEIANINTASQVVISGHTEAVDWVAGKAKELRVARRTVPLNTSAPFHTSLMQPAAQSLRELLQLMANPTSNGGGTKDPVVGVVANVNAEVLTTREAVVENFFSQATQPVQWHQCMMKAKALLRKSDHVFCIGPGTTLTGFFKSESVDAVTVNDVDSIKKLSTVL